MDIREAVLSVLNGDSIENAVSDLVLERLVCRYQGPPMQRKTKTGRTYYVRKRVCQGRANPQIGRKISRAFRRGHSKQLRRYIHRMRWRGSLKRKGTPLPGQTSSGPRKIKKKAPPKLRRR